MSHVGQWPRVWAVALLHLRPRLAQVNTATIYGTVTDPSGAAVPQATVNASNHQTGGTLECHHQRERRIHVHVSARRQLHDRDARSRIQGIAQHQRGTRRRSGSAPDDTP